MNNEKFEKRKEFILEQHTQFAAGMRQLRQAQTQTERIVTQAGETVGRLANGTLERFKDMNDKINALVDSQKRTRQDLRNLIAKLDRYFSEGRNRN